MTDYNHYREAIRDLVGSLHEIDHDAMPGTSYGGSPEAIAAIEDALAGTPRAIVRFEVDRSIVEEAIGQQLTRLAVDDAKASEFIDLAFDGVPVGFDVATGASFIFTTEAGYYDITRGQLDEWLDLPEEDDGADA